MRGRRIAWVIYAMAAAMVTISLLGRSQDTPKSQQPAEAAKLEKAIFAGGCFWCEEAAFEPLTGVVSVVSGYTGGTAANPTYEQVSAGGTGHAEAVEVTFDPAQVSYSALLDVFWKNTDPLAVDRQFCDVGNQYRSAIFYQGDEQKRLAETSRDKIASSGRFKEPIATRIEAAGVFYPAEEYHQDYYKKNPVRYKFYRFGCGRDARLEELWGKPAAPPAH